MLDGKVQAAFNLSPKTAALFDHYQSVTNAQGPLENAFSTHQEQLYKARSYLSKLMEDSAAHARIPAAQQALADTRNTDHPYSARNAVREYGGQVDRKGS